MSQTENLCDFCGSQDIALQQYGDTLPFKGLSLDVDGLTRSHCNTCGYTYETHEQHDSNLGVIRAAFKAQRASSQKEQGLLTGSEVYAIRKRLDLSQKDAARLFGGGPNAFSKYENDEVLVSFAMSRLLEMAEHFGKPALEFLEARARQEKLVRVDKPLNVLSLETIGKIVRAPKLERAQKLAKYEVKVYHRYVVLHSTLGTVAKGSKFDETSELLSAIVQGEEEEPPLPLTIPSAAVQSDARFYSSTVESAFEGTLQ